MRYTICKNSSTTLVIALGITLSSGASAQNGNPNPGVHPIDSKPYGLSYGEWSAKWWQWLLQIPPETNPILDTTGVNCAQGQSGHVWFLPGTFGGPAFRTCRVPAGRSLFFPILNTSFGAGVGDCQTPAPGNPASCDSYTFGSLTGVAALHAAAAAQMSNPESLEASIDGAPLKNLTAYQAQSPVFSYVLTSDNLYNFAFGFNNPAGVYSPAVSDGYWVMLTPLPEGPHTLHFRGVINGGSFTTEVTYNLIVERMKIRAIGFLQGTKNSEKSKPNRFRCGLTARALSRSYS
jgi:hypothetical protein